MDKSTNTGSFNEDFRTSLEWHLTRTFQNSQIKEIKGLWCDGILPAYLSGESLRKNVNDTGKLTTTAFIGKDGQSKYEMTIHFGKFSLRRFAKGTDLKDCIPGEESMDWINIDIENKVIEIQLR